MKIQMLGSGEYTAQLLIQITPESDIEKALLESLDGHNSTFRMDGDLLEAKLSIGRDGD